jgi:hypothetical protein
MTCYDETRDKEGLMGPVTGPRIRRDGQNVREIAEDAKEFLGHSVPRYHEERNQDWRKGE